MKLFSTELYFSSSILYNILRSILWNDIRIWHFNNSIYSTSSLPSISSSINIWSSPMVTFCIISSWTSTWDAITSSGTSFCPLKIVSSQQNLPTSGRIEWRISTTSLIFSNFDGPPSALNNSRFNYRLYLFFSTAIRLWLGMQNKILKIGFLKIG